MDTLGSKRTEARLKPSVLLIAALLVAGTVAVAGAGTGSPDAGLDPGDGNAAIDEPLADASGMTWSGHHSDAPAPGTPDARGDGTDNHDAGPRCPIFFPPGTPEPVRRLCHDPPPLPVAEPTGAVLGWEERTLELALSVDVELVDERTPDWRKDVFELVDKVDAFYRASFDIRIEVVDLHVHDFDAATTDPLLGIVSSHYRADHPDLDRDVTHHLSGKPSPNFLGMATVETAGNPDQAFSWSAFAHYPPIPLEGTSFEYQWDIYEIAMAHEIGHTLAAIHEYHNCAEGALEADTRAPGTVCTLMTPLADLTSFHVSTLNRLVIRGYADEVDI